MGKQKTPDETEEARALAEIAAQRFNRYKEVFAPLEDQYIEQVFDVRDQGNYEQAGGLAAAAYQPQFQAASDKLTGQMFQQGVDPTAGAYQENSAALRRAAAVKQGLGVSAAKTANTDRFYQGLKGVIQMGQGQASEAIGGLANIAANAESRAISDAEKSFTNSSMIRSAGAGLAGYGAAVALDPKLNKTGTTNG